MYYLFLKLSRFFFDLAIRFDKEDRKPFPIELLQPFQKCTFGIFIKPVQRGENTFALFANSSIGFFFRDVVFQEEVIEYPFAKIAIREELYDVKKYIIDKIVESHEELELLNEIQPDLQNEQAIRATHGEA